MVATNNNTATADVAKANTVATESAPAKTASPVLPASIAPVATAPKVAIAKRAAKKSTTVARAPAKTAIKPAVKTPAKTVAKAPAKTPVKAAVKTVSKAVVKTPAKQAIKAVTPSKVEKTSKGKKPKLVRDSFTIPKAEYTVLDDLKQRAGKLASSVKKSELIRAGVKALAAMSDSAFLAALKAVPTIKTGRPTKAKSE